jgi:MFS family permease
MSYLFGIVTGSLIGGALFAAVVKWVSKLLKAQESTQKWAWRGAFAFGFLCLMVTYITYDSTY